MDRLATMESFVMVVEAGSFVVAATRLGMSPAMVSRYVMNLEERLGTRLINRTTRRLNLTEAGAAYFERCQQVLRDIEEIELCVSSEVQQPRGVLRLNAPISFGIRHLSPLLCEYESRYPDVAIDLDLTDRFVDLVEEGADIALRVGVLPESTLVARRLFPVRLVVCASPAYLKKNGVPRTVKDLESHNCLGYTYTRSGAQWEFAGPNGPVAVPIGGTLRSNNGEVLRRAAIDGLGVLCHPTFIVGDAISAGLLTPIQLDHSPVELGGYAVFLSRKFLSAKVRTFVDFLAEKFGPQPYWDQWEIAASGKTKGGATRRVARRSHG